MEGSMNRNDFIDKIILAPMAGVTDLPFRLLCKEAGSDIGITEMVSAKGLMYNEDRADLLLLTDEKEKPVGIQIFGSEPQIMAEQAKKLADRGRFDFVDINMGCPVPKIVNNGEGSALMKNPELAREIVRSIKAVIDIPLTVKIRAGFAKDDRNAAHFAKVLAENGADAIAVHARTREEYYSGHADWSVIKEVKESVNIPVIGNGDIASYEDMLRMKEETGCDSVMVGRAARGNPWIFTELKTGIKHEKSTQETVEMIKRHTEMMVQMKGEYIGIREMRKHVGWYTAGIKNSSKLRCKINEAETMEEMFRLLEAL